MMQNMTPLLLAAMHGDAESVSQLLDSGSDLEACMRDGSTALIMAAANGHEDALTVLIHAGANVNARDREGNTALMVAADQRLPDILDILIKAGADLNIENNSRFTALDLAMIPSQFETSPAIVTQLIRAGVEKSRCTDINDCIEAIRSHDHMAVIMIVSQIIHVASWVRDALLPFALEGITNCVPSELTKLKVDDEDLRSAIGARTMQLRLQQSENAPASARRRTHSTGL